MQVETEIIEKGKDNGWVRRRKHLGIENFGVKP